MCVKRISTPECPTRSFAATPPLKLELRLIDSLSSSLLWMSTADDGDFRVTATGCRIHTSAVITNPARLKLGARCTVSQGAILDAVAGPIVVGIDSFIGDGANLVAVGADGLACGDRVVIGAGAIVRAKHLGHDVHIGERATLESGSAILDSSVVTAGSTVPTGAILPPASVFDGSPGMLLPESSLVALGADGRCGPPEAVELALAARDGLSIPAAWLHTEPPVG